MIKMNYSIEELRLNQYKEFIAVKNKINMDRRLNVETATQLVDELSETLKKEKKYVKFTNRLMGSINTAPSTKMWNGFGTIDLKFRRLSVKGGYLRSQFMAAAKKRENDDEWVGPLMNKEYDETASLEEFTIILAKLEEGASAVAQRKAEFQTLLAKWEEMKAGLNAGLDSCIQRIQELMEEKEN